MKGQNLHKWNIETRTVPFTKINSERVREGGREALLQLGGVKVTRRFPVKVTTPTGKAIKSRAGQEFQGYYSVPSLTTSSPHPRPRSLASYHRQVLGLVISHWPSSLICSLIHSTNIQEPPRVSKNCPPPCQTLAPWEPDPESGL